MRRLSLFVCILLLSACAEIRSCNTTCALWDGKSLNHWQLILTDSRDVDRAVRIHDGVLTLAGGPIKGYLRSDKKYQNFKLTVDWRWTEEVGNGGILVQVDNNKAIWPKAMQAQLKYEHLGDIIAMEGIKAESLEALPQHTLPTSRDLSAPVGTWTQTQVIMQNGDMRVVVNGQLVNQVSGLNTAAGYLGLQLEGVAIDYRSIVIEQLL